jgi:transcriptional regulator with XRE-family HTH domain
VKLNDEDADKLAIAIGERLVSYRVALSLKQLEVSEATGISRSQLSRYEAGTTLPSVPTLITLAEFYGVALDKVGRGADNVKFTDLRLRKSVADVEAKGPDFCRLLHDLIEEVIYDGGKKKKPEDS